MIQSPANLVEEVTTRIRDSVRTDIRGDCYRIAFRAMSTPVNLVFVAPSPAIGNEFQRRAVDWIAQFEARYSRFLPASIIGQINANAGGDWIDVDEDAHQIFSLCDEMYRLTHGIFDPTALPLLRAWDWKSQPVRVPSEAEILAAREISGWEKVRREDRAIRLPIAGMGIDLGGIGKEFAVDQVCALAREFGVLNVMIDIGQDIRVAGKSPGKDAWYIGLEEPNTPGQCWTAVRLTDHAVATSGDYFRSFTINGRRYGHILDPRTGWPVSNTSQSVSVIAPKCVLAGILSTAAFILGPGEGLNLIRSQPGVEACITTETARHQTRKFSSYVPA
jgi:FAD:protein FMN transferase